MRGRRLRLAVVGMSWLTMMGHGVGCHAAAHLVARQRGLLAKIPADSKVYIYTANVAALDAKIRLMESRLNSPNGFDPIASLLRQFGPATAINFNRPAAAAVLSWPRQGALMAQPLAVAFLASNKPTVTLAAFGAKSIGHGIYQGSIAQAPMPFFIAVRGHYIILSDQAASVRKYLVTKFFLGSQLSPAQRHFLHKSDVAVSLYVRGIYRLYRQQMKMMAQVNGVQQQKKKVKAAGRLSTADFYKKALKLLAIRVLHRMIAQMPQVMFTVQFKQSGMFFRMIAVPRAGTAMARAVQSHRSLGKTPFAGLPAGRYMGAGVATVNGRAAAARLSRAELVWKKHTSIRLDQRYPALKRQMAKLLGALADMRGFSEITYVGKKTPGQNGPAIQLVHIARAGMHLQQMLAWLKQPADLTLAGSEWGKARWTVKPATLDISGLRFTEVTGQFPAKPQPAAPAMPPGAVPGLSVVIPTPQSIFGSGKVCFYAASLGNRIILADARVADRLPQVINQIQKHQQDLPQLPDIAEVTPLQPAHAGLLVYLPLARWASLTGRQTGKPLAGAVVIGAPAPPLLISGSVEGGCMVYRIYLAYALIRSLHSSSPWGLFAF